MIDRSVYKLTDAGITLERVDVDDDTTSYHIKPGTIAVAADAFKPAGFITEVTIPASLKYIPAGTFSNGGSWADKERGIDKINISEGNRNFRNIGNCFCGILSDGSCKLIRVTGSPQKITVPGEITQICRDSFKGCTVSEVRVEAYDTVIYFPVSHAFFLSLLLEGFGKNEKLYDFSDYDAFLLRNHFNAERVRMIKARLEKPYDCSPEMQHKLKSHVLSSFDDICEMLIKSGTADVLEDLACIGFFTADNIDDCIESINRAKKDELKMWLLEYKNSRFGFDGFDFTL